MSVPAAEADRRTQQFAHALREAGLRLTHQRLEVIREIASTDEHPDVETVYRGVRERVPTISVDTVYRTLAVLSAVGLVSRITATTGAVRYDANLAGHDHFVCTRCGLVRDVSSRSDLPTPPEEVADLGSVMTVEIQYRGVCERCASELGRASN